MKQVLFALAVVGGSWVGASEARAWHEPSVWVPFEYDTIQEAVDAATPGTRIHVAPGRWCGATLTKRVHILGWGHAEIIGCEAPARDDGLRVGFALEPGADGSTIRHLWFDGRDIDSDDLTPLGMAVHGADVDDVLVIGNVVRGTAQAITNTGGSNWVVADNRLVGFTALTCNPGLCGGGVGVVLQQRDPASPRATGNVVADNRIVGLVPDGLTEFSVVGVYVVGQEGASVTGNRLKFTDEGQPEAVSVGIEVVSNNRDLLVVGNLGRDADYVLVVYEDAPGSDIFWNRGLHDILGDVFWR